MTSDAPRSEVREALLAAARTELLEHGLAAISLRAVARRAGVSHAAPKYHFRDRAGLLTVVATEGFQAFARALAQVAEPSPQQQLAALGRAYVDFGLTHPALFELMFAPHEVHPADAALTRARRDAFAKLSAAVDQLAAAEETPAQGPTLALISWALAHGLVVLARDGALQRATDTSAGNVADLAHTLTDLYSQHVSRSLAGENSDHPPASPSPPAASPDLQSQFETPSGEQSLVTASASTIDPGLVGWTAKRFGPD